MRVLGISGSLRHASTNSNLLSAAVLLAPPGMRLTLTSNITSLPPFTPDLEPSRIDVVARWVDEVRDAQGIIVSTPVYAGGYPGALKNAFDWLVGTDAYVSKPFMMLSASDRSQFALDTFVKVLETMSGVHIEGASTTVPLLGSNLTAADIVADAPFAERIRSALIRFVEAVSQLPGVGE